MHMDVYDMISLKYIQNFNLLSRLLALTVLVLNGSLFRNLTLVSYCRASPDLHCFSSALSQARRGPTHPVTVMFYTPRGRAAIRNPWP